MMNGNSGRRLLSALSALVPLVMVLESCAPAATPASQANQPTATGDPVAALYDKAKQEGSVVWYGQFSESQASGIIEAFTKKYPGVDVKFSDLKPTELMTQVQVQERARNVQIDVAGVTDTNVPGLLDLGIIDDTIDWTKFGVSPDQFPVSRGLVQDFSLGDFIVYNTTKVSADEAPRTWDDLLLPRWKGRIAVDGRATFLDALYLDPGKGRDAGLAYASKLADQQPSYQANLEQVLAAVVSGQFDLGTAVLSQVLFAQASGKPVGIASVSPIYLTRHWLYLPKAAPHPAAAQLFTSWAVSQEGQAAMGTSYNAALPMKTTCPGNGLTVIKALCDNHLEWYSPQTVEQLKDIADYETKARAIFGTGTGS